MRRKATTPVPRLFVTLMGLSSVWICLARASEPVAVWPAIDNLPAVCRKLDPTCLSNDFFTNASSERNGRTPYVALLTVLTRFADNGLVGGLALIKGVLLVALPMAITWLICLFLAIRSHDLARSNLETGHFGMLLSLLVVPGIVIFLQSSIVTRFCIAWWPALGFEATAHNLTLLLVIAGYCLLLVNRRIMAGVFLAVSSVIHPVMALLGSVFAYIVLVDTTLGDRKRNRNLLIAGLSVGLGVLCHLIVFGSSGNLSGSLYAYIYAVEAHPEHYIPSKFGSLSGLHWLISFGLVVAGLVILAILLKRSQDPTWKNAILALLSYVTAVLVQFIFVELYPVKIITQLGISRYTTFGPWFLGFFFAHLILRWSTSSKMLSSNGAFRYLFILITRYVSLVLIFSMLAIFLAVYSAKAKHFEPVDESTISLYDFAKRSKESDVFVLPFDAGLPEFPLQTRRAIFFGNGFPFSESSFLEWLNRKAYVFGLDAQTRQLPGSWIGEKYANHYRRLRPADFVRMSTSYKLDYVVVETGHLQYFKTCQISHKTARYTVFSIQALRICQ